MCHQDKHYTSKLIWVDDEHTDPSTVRVKVHAPLPQLRLLSKQLTHEYDSRAPANTILFAGANMSHRHTFKLDQNATKSVVLPPYYSREDERRSRHQNLKFMRFEIAGALTRSIQTTFFERVAEIPAPGSVRLCLRFHDAPPDIEYFMRIFGDLEISYSEQGKDDQPLRLVDVVLLSGGWPLSLEMALVVRTWTPRGGFVFDGVAPGVPVHEWPETSDESSDSGSDNDSDCDGEADGATEEETEDANESDEASQSGSKTDYQSESNEKLEDLKLADGVGNHAGEGDGEINGETEHMNVSDEPNNTGSDLDATAEEETRDPNTSDESSHSDDSSESDGEQPFASLSIPEKLIDNPSLGLFDRLPKELRDTIHDLCHQKKRYNIGLNNGRVPGTLRLRINAPLPQMRLINRSIKAEYESRAPADAVLVNGGVMHLGYTFSLDHDQRYSKFDRVHPPLWCDLHEKSVLPHNTKLMLFEISGIKTPEFMRQSMWVRRHEMTTPPDGSFTMSLRFYDSFSTNLNELTRVFADFDFSYTPELRNLDDWKALQLAEVTLHSGKRRLNERTAYVPTIGTWTQQDGFKLDDTPHGASHELKERVKVLDDSVEIDGDMG